MNVDDVDDLADFGEPAGHGQPGLDDIGEAPAAGELPPEDFGEPFAEKALGLTLRTGGFFKPSTEPGLDDLGEPVSAEADLDVPSAEHGLTNLPVLALGLTLRSGRFCFESSTEPGLDDFGEAVSAEAGLDDPSAEHGLSNLLVLGLSPSAEAGLFFSLTISASHVYPAGI